MFTLANINVKNKVLEDQISDHKMILTKIK